MTFHIIGIRNKLPNFTSSQKDLINSTRVFSGGKRHYELVKKHLPDEHLWIPITSPMSEVFEAYDEMKELIVVFASGNPLFYGLSNTLKNKYPNTQIITEPYFSSIQLLANATNTNTNHLQTVSVHGRDWSALDTVLIEQKELIGVLTDAKKNPRTIAQRMLEYGYDNYKMLVGEDIEGEEEQFHELTLPEASKRMFHPLNCILLKKRNHRNISFGIPDSEFLGLPGRPNMITKMPVRLTTLHFLDILNCKTLWDIGFCTGSVSIEAKLKNANLEVIAFEKRAECEVIIEENQKRFGVPGIQVVIGDFFDQDFTTFSKPDAVFIGGHGGRLKELLIRIKPLLQPQATLVINAVKETSISIFKNTCADIGYDITDTQTITIDQHNPITILKAKSSLK